MQGDVGLVGDYQAMVAETAGGNVEEGVGGPEFVNGAVVHGRWWRSRRGPGRRVGHCSGRHQRWAPRVWTIGSRVGRWRGRWLWGRGGRVRIFLFRMCGFGQGPRSALGLI